MKPELLPVILLLGSVSLSGCYLDKGDEESFPSYMKTGTLIDSPVSSMTYRINGGAEKQTNFKGQFSYEDGDLIRFYLGDYAFPAVTAQEIITPMTLAGVDDINDRRVINIAFILQALDTDMNPDNGIEITDSLYGASFEFDFDQEFNDFLISFDVDELIWGYLNGETPAYDDVVDHLSRQLGVRGTWVSGSGVVLNFLKDSAVLAVNANGYEYGQYSYDSIEGTLTVSISDDYNGDEGFGPQMVLTVIEIDSDVLVLESEDAETSYSRTEDSLLGLAYTWFFNDVDTGDRYLLNLYSDYNYQLVRVSSDDGGDT
ncbi:MAG: hypothetical protein VW274_11385, partial [Thalassolituus sp.]